jgi:hypothetical protein
VAATRRRASLTVRFVTARGTVARGSLSLRLPVRSGSRRARPGASLRLAAAITAR